MSINTLAPVQLSRENFKDFGNVVDLKNHPDIKTINYGMTQRYNNMAELDLYQNNGQPLFNIFRSKPVEFPFKIEMLERHPLSSQLFYPLSNNPFLVLVAENGATVTAESLKLFITNGFQGINYKRNTWHHYVLALSKNSDFVVIDRGGEGNNCEEYFLQEDVFITDQISA